MWGVEIVSPDVRHLAASSATDHGAGGPRAEPLSKASTLLRKLWPLLSSYMLGGRHGNVAILAPMASPESE
jgi:hypothetical protein